MTDEGFTCECGCGRPVGIAKSTRPEWGHIKGEPMRFVRGHHARDNRPREVRFWEQVEVHDCWVWTGGRHAAGYGMFKVTIHGVLTAERAHRVAYELLVGPIPDGLVLDHLCRNRLCVNPDHLEPVTDAENFRRGVGPSSLNRRKTHCKRGHPLGGDNLYIAKSGSRVCKECLRFHKRNRRARLRAAA